MNIFISYIAISVISISFLFSQEQTVGVFIYDQNTYNGYTLFSPSKNTYLIDNCGNLINQWTSQYQTGLSIYLLEDGTLLRTNRINTNNVFSGGGIGGGLEKLDWDGNVMWSYLYNSENYHQHHDVEVLPNGNILILAWERKTAEEAISQGRNPDLLEDNELWPEHIIEIEPIGNDAANIVWEWHLWDHLIQDFDSSLPNYGVVSDNPQLIDVNYTGPGQNAAGGKADWIHANSLDYNEDLDQIIISSRSLSEFWIIDHSTTTEEAAINSGGNSGMGGNILYRWGNPMAYDSGGMGDRTLFGPHHIQWIDKNLPGGDNILIFNNGKNRPDGDYSSVDEIQVPIDGYNYIIDSDSAYGPEELFWTYVAPNNSDFFADHISGCQRLPNGNTLICSGPQGRFFEVNNGGDILWEYINPVYGNTILNQGDSPPDGPFGLSSNVNNSVFRCERFDIDFSGFLGYDMIPGLPIEGPPYLYPSLCNPITLYEEKNNKYLIQRIDILGRSINNQNRLFVDFYNDGSFEKVYYLK